MSAAGSTDSGLIRAAAAGELPGWSLAGAPRREHMSRVAALMRQWAEALGLDAAETEEWEAVGYLHDALRDAPPAELREQVPPEFRDLPGPLLHGPAAAERLRGRISAEVEDAIRYHTTGHPRLTRLGRALYLADFLEPGRDFEQQWRESLAARMPGELDAVLVEVLDARIRHLLDVRKPIRGETTAFWSELVRSR